MGLQAVYEKFLQAPSPQNLTEDATLQYVTTLTSFKQDNIVKHLGHQNENVVRKKAEKVISSVEGLTSVALIVETTLQFLSSGGAYLPGLDSFIIDRTATLPVVSQNSPLSKCNANSCRRTLSTSTKMTRSHRSDLVGIKVTS